jgi:hypothetical protein
MYRFYSSDSDSLKRIVPEVYGPTGSQEARHLNGEKRVK